MRDTPKEQMYVRVSLSPDIKKIKQLFPDYHICVTFL